MNCVKCSGELVKVDKTGKEVYQCNKCSGIWFDFDIDWLDDPSIVIGEILADTILMRKKDYINTPNSNIKYNFDNFVTNKNNDFAYSAAQSVSRKPGSCFNPLFLYGKPNCGKTHLMQAIANETLRIRKNFKIEYLTSEELLSLYIDSIEYNNLLKFRKRFASSDMLLIDGVQCLTEKEHFQEEFLNIFDQLYNDSKQIVLASYKAPSDIAKLSEKLLKRFECGLCVDIQLQ